MGPETRSVLDRSSGPFGDATVRRSRGVLLPPAFEGRPRRRDLYRALRSAVLDGVLGPRERMPSSRRAAVDYGVSRGLVEEVYRQLNEEGFLERGVGRGTFVTEQAARLMTPSGGSRAARNVPAPSRRGLALVSGAACREPEKPRAFNAGIAD